MKKTLLILSSTLLLSTKIAFCPGVKFINNSGKNFEGKIDNFTGPEWVLIKNKETVNLPSKSGDRKIYWREYEETKFKKNPTYSTKESYSLPDTITINDSGKKYDMVSGVLKIKQKDLEPISFVTQATYSNNTNLIKALIEDEKAIQKIESIKELKEKLIKLNNDKDSLKKAMESKKLEKSKDHIELLNNQINLIEIISKRIESISKKNELLEKSKLEETLKRISGITDLNQIKKEKEAQIKKIESIKITKETAKESEREKIILEKLNNREIQLTPKKETKVLKIKDAKGELIDVPTETECGICLDKISKDDENKIVKLTTSEPGKKCNHIFHKACIEQWFKTTATSTQDRCPSCKAKVRANYIKTYGQY